MRYYRKRVDSTIRLFAREGDDLFDLTDVDPTLDDFADLARAARLSGSSIDTIAKRLSERDEPVSADQLDGPLLPPMRARETWAAGVTYRISEEAREAESGMPEVYLNVYEAERPELFFKATPARTVGSGDDIGIRRDSSWDVPEPELTIALYQGDIVGYTVGNDVSSRSIEGENPLYLPQAKVYDRSCAVGPCIRSRESMDDPHDLTMSMRIERGGETVFEDQTSTSQMVRTCEELVSFYLRHNSVPETAFLLTGTSLVPSDDFTLRENDRVQIEIDQIGRLQNGVREV